MRGDRIAWALAGAGLLVPIAADAAGLSFVVRDIDGGPYHFIPPLWTLVLQPIVFIGLVLNQQAVLAIGAAFNALLGLGMVFGSVIQLPLALLIPSNSLEGVPRLDIFIMHVAAIATGAVWAAFAARVATK